MKTTEEIYQTLLAAFAQRAGFTPEADCDLAVRLDIQSEWVLDQSFPQTARGVYLDYHAQMRGIARTAATKAVGTLRFSVERAPSTALSIAAGTACMTEGETRFQTTAEAVPAAVTRRTTRACGAGFWRAISGCPTGPTRPGTSRPPWAMRAWRQPGQWAGPGGSAQWMYTSPRRPDCRMGHCWRRSRRTCRSGGRSPWTCRSRPRRRWRWTCPRSWPSGRGRTSPR